jgi:CubicO group peptidase (beta-lactamase class C family)
MKEISRILENSLSERLFQAATFRVFDGQGTLLEIDSGECGISSIFDVASITKIFTALIFSRLMTQCKITGETKIGDLDCIEVPPDKRDITLLSLLSHTSGLPDYVPFYKRFAKEGGGIERVGREEAYGQIVDEMLSTPLLSRPEERILYSDPGYILLAHIIEKLTDLPLERLLETLVTGPAGLIDTCFTPLARYHQCETGRFVSSGFCPVRSKEVVGEVEDLNCSVLGGVSGHAGIFSTGYDLEKLGRAFFGTLAGEEGVFDAEEVSFLLEEVRDDLGNRRRVGFDVPAAKGSAAGRYFSENSGGHLGFTGVSLWLDFEREAGMVFLANRVYCDGDREKFNGVRRKVHDRAWELLAL